MDRHLANGVDEHLELPEANMLVPPPCSEEVFDEHGPARMERLDLSPATDIMKTDPSLNFLHCKLWSLRHTILR